MIEKYTNMGQAYTPARIVEEAKKRGMGLDLAGVHDISWQGGRLLLKGRELEERDFVIHRVKQGFLKDKIADRAKYSFNKTELLRRYISKANELDAIRGTDIPFPKSIVAAVEGNYEFLRDCLGEAFVAKGLYGSQGSEVYLIRSEQDYRSLRNQYTGETEMLFQSYIEESYGRDVRLFVIAGEIVAGMQRQAARNTFKANFALGGRVLPLEIDESMRYFAGKAYEATGVEIFGLDLLYGGKDYLFCEINVTPGIEGMERATSVNIAGNIIDYISSAV